MQPLRLGILTLALIVAGCGGGTATPTVDLGTLAAPASISVAVANQRATVSWEPVAGATGYHVYRASAPGITREFLPALRGAQVRAVTESTTSFTFEGLVPGKVYYFTVDAYDARGESPMSEERSAILPPEPVMAMMSVPSPGSLTIAWSQAVGAESYDLYIAADPSVSSTNWAGLPGGARWADLRGTARVGGLVNGERYYFVVVSRNDGGHSLDSHVGTGTPVAAPLPPPYAYDVVAVPGPGEVQVSWKCSATDVVCVLYVAQDPTLTSDNWASLPGGQRIEGCTSPFMLDGLDANVPYYFLVTLMRNGTEGPDSPVASAVPNGRGTFTPTSSVSMGAGIVDMVVADFDGDYIDDIATVNARDATVSFARGVGDGTFELYASYWVGDNVSSIAVGDWDRNGILDWAVAIPDYGRVEIYIGYAPFSWYTYDYIWDAYTPSHVEAADVDLDGNVDLLVADEYYSQVVVMMGYGWGSFWAREYVPVGGGTAQILVDDLDVDGYPDFLTVDANASTVSVAMNMSWGFDSPKTLSVGSAPADAILADMNADGTLDLMVTSSANNTAEFYLGAGDGTFAAESTIDTGAYPRGLAAGDFDGDGARDFVVGNHSDATLSVFRGDALGGFRLRQTVSPLLGGPAPIRVGDFDGDSILDLAVACEDEGVVQILLGND